MAQNINMATLCHISHDMEANVTVILAKQCQMQYLPHFKTLEFYTHFQVSETL